MNIILSILLYVVTSHGHTYLFTLLLGSVLFCLLVAAIVFQRRQGQKLKSEFKSLLHVKRHGVQHELVLKAMKLSTWRLDVLNKTITYEYDYRERTDLYVPKPGSNIEKSFRHMFHEDVDRIKKAFDDLCAGKVDDFYMQYRVKLPHTDLLAWEESYATVAERDPEGKPTSIVGTSSCIDDKKKMEQEIIEARNKAEESDLLKSAFIANISHEVRTPLNAIVGFSDVLTSVTDPEEQHKLVTIIKENNRKLVRIFEDMMDMSKVEARKSKDMLELSEFDIVEVLKEIVDRFAAHNPKPSVEIKSAFLEDKLTIRSDKGRIIQVIDHFMDNAVKFTKEGSITLGMSYDAGLLTISVTDTGCGIPEKMRDRVFDRFIKVDTFAQGAGLGLSVCRSYTYSLQGIIGVDSEEGIGSRFWIKIPERI